MKVIKMKCVCGNIADALYNGMYSTCPKCGCVQRKSN